MFKRAFTLAEVLITLGIIGVVASLTIPTVIKNYKAKQYEVGFKTAYSLLEQAVRTLNSQDIIISQNRIYEYDTIGNATGYDCVKLFAEAFKGATNFQHRGPYSGYKTFTNKNFNTGMMDDGFFELPNGMSVFFEIFNSTNHPALIIDTNGYQKKPNRFGFDTFIFIIGENDKVYAVGDPNIALDGILRSQEIAVVLRQGNEYCSLENTSSGSNGATCAYKAFTDVNYWKNLPK